METNNTSISTGASTQTSSVNNTVNNNEHGGRDYNSRTLFYIDRDESNMVSANIKDTKLETTGILA